MEFKDLPKTWRGINIDFLGSSKFSDLIELYSIKFSNNKFDKTVSFCIPKVEKNRFYLNGNKYIIWYRICKPICSIEYIDNKQIVNIHSILTRPDRSDNYDMQFYLNEGKRYCKYKNIEYDIDDLYLHDLFYSYWLTNMDRIDLNQYIGSENDYNHLTEEDINNIFNILNEDPEYTTNWKDILELRIIGLEDLIISTIMLSLSEVLRDFHKGEVNQKVLERNIRAFMATEAPEIRLDLNETEISSYSQNRKVILPFNNYCNVSELLPDPSWYDYIDLLDSPQSIKVGSVAALSDDVKIVNRKIKPNLEEVIF